MNKKTILVAMSGGVDSSVAALLLKKEGYQVTGIFFKFWKEENSSLCHNLFENKCCSQESSRIARSVAQKLKIKLYSVNLERQFKKEVVDYYISEYEDGRTPNPCSVCNKMIKFGYLRKIALELGINKIATGHYARIKKREGHGLFRGIDKDKDQSYFLWQLRPHLLKQIEFPVGNYKKDKIRQIAKMHHLESAENKDSRGLCFIGKTNVVFLKKHAKTLLTPGDVVNIHETVIGKHKGLAHYTVGQRTGFIITNKKWQKNKKHFPPLYVKKLDIINNKLVVAEEKAIYSKSFNIKNISWLDNKAKKLAKASKLHSLGQIRYLHEAIPCKVIKQDKIVFSKPVRAITPGQSCVLYNKNGRVLGGGFINKVIEDEKTDKG